jgi:hypothetical protein
MSLEFLGIMALSASAEPPGPAGPGGGARSLLPTHQTLGLTASSVTSTKYYAGLAGLVLTTQRRIPSRP